MTDARSGIEGTTADQRVAQHEREQIEQDEARAERHADEYDVDENVSLDEARGESDDEAEDDGAEPLDGTDEESEDGDESEG